MKCNIPQNQKHEPKARNREAEAIIRQKYFESILAPLGCVPTNKNKSASEKEGTSPNE